MVKNPPCNAEDVGLIPVQATKIPRSFRQLSPQAATTEPTCSGAHVSQLESLWTATKLPQDATKDLVPLRKTQCSKLKNKTSKQKQLNQECA